MTDTSLTTAQSSAFALDTTDSELAAFYRENAQVGFEYISNSLPQLKVTEALSKNLMEDGTYAPRGTFFYAPTKETFKESEVSILAVSKGFYALDQSTPPVPKFNQLVGGVLLPHLQPFVLFCYGTRWKNMADFMKDMSAYTKSKTAPVPLFAFRVKLTLELRKNEKGQESYVINYSLVRNAENKIELITDKDMLKTIREGIERVQEMFENFIEQKEVDKETGLPLQKNLDQREAEEAFATIVGEDPDKNIQAESEPADTTPTQEATKVADDIPF